MSKPIKTTLNPSDQALLHKIESVYGTVKALMGLNLEITDIIIEQDAEAGIWIKEPNHYQRYLFSKITLIKVNGINFSTTIETTTFRDVRISWEITATPETHNANQ